MSEKVIRKRRVKTGTIKDEEPDEKPKKGRVKKDPVSVLTF